MKYDFDKTAKQYIKELSHKINKNKSNAIKKQYKNKIEKVKHINDLYGSSVLFRGNTPMFLYSDPYELSDDKDHYLHYSTPFDEEKCIIPDYIYRKVNFKNGYTKIYHNFDSEYSFNNNNYGIKWINFKMKKDNIIFEIGNPTTSPLLTFLNDKKRKEIQKKIVKKILTSFEDIIKDNHNHICTVTKESYMYEAWKSLKDSNLF